MNVLMITQDYPPDLIGGIGKHAAALTEALISEGVRVRVLTLANRLSSCNEDSVIRAPHSLFNVPAVQDSEGWSPLKILHENIEMAAAAGDCSPYDVIHCQDIFAAPVAYSLAKLNGKPLVFTKHFITPLDSNFSKPDLPPAAKIIESYFHLYGIRLQQWCCYGPQRIIAVSREIAERIISLAPEAEEKCTVIPNGTDISFCANPTAVTKCKVTYCPNGETLLLVVGRIVWKKGGDIAIKAVKELADLPIRLIFAGVGSYQEALEQLACDLGIQHKVSFIGFIADEKLSCLYAASDIVLAPSRSEGFSISIIEALMLRKLVIASDIDAIKNVQIKDRHNGLLFEADNEKDLAKKIRWALNNPLPVNDIQERAFADAGQNYSWKAIGKKVLHEYQQAIQAGAS